MAALDRAGVDGVGGWTAGRSSISTSCRSTTTITVRRKILAREMRALAEGRTPKRWAPASADVVPTLGF